MKTGALTLILLGSLCIVPALNAQQTAAAGPDAVTPPELVAAYDSVADTIMATKKAEWNIVYSILAATYNHAEGIFRQARARMQSGKDARAETEKLATLVAQLGNEGDAGVARVRKRLIDGGHHHNAAGEQQGVYDKGFVVVTRKAKKTFLDAAAGLGKLGGAADSAALEAQWKSVKTQFADITNLEKR